MLNLESTTYEPRQPRMLSKTTLLSYSPKNPCIYKHTYRAFSTPTGNLAPHRSIISASRTEN
jgi:hypothetical protein